MCKLDHSDEASIPAFLCRACNPREALPIIETIQAPVVSDPGFNAKRVKRQLRKLRAEERRLSDMIDSLQGRDPAMVKKLYVAIKEVEDQIEKVAA